MVKIYENYSGEDLVYDVDAYFNISKIDIERSKELFLYLEGAQDLIKHEERGCVL